MPVQLLENVSFNLVRTNPKLTTNIKIIVDSKDNIFLESFDANPELSRSNFKGFKVDPLSSYEKDLFRFYKNGTFPKNLAYDVFQERDDVIVYDEYKMQFETFYNAGAEIITSQIYDEQIGIFAPLWLDKIIPNYFVIFKVDGPVSINSKNATTETEYQSAILDPSNFLNNVIKKSTIIKTFDLTENSNIGKYIRTYFNNYNFPKSPLNVSFDRNKQSGWAGINYNSIGFSSKGEYFYDKFIKTDRSIMETEYQITKGFEQFGVVCANLLNLEFLFDDTTSENYEINRYFGLYVNEVEEGTFKLNRDKFYHYSRNETTQLPIPTQNDFIDLKKVNDYTVTNKNGILLYVKDIVSETDIPTYYDALTLPSYFYIKDINGNYHNLKAGHTWNMDELRIADKEINLNTLYGLDIKNYTVIDAEKISESGKAHCMFTVNGTLPHGYSIDFYIERELLHTTDDNWIGQIASNRYLADNVRTDYTYFNPKGSNEEVAKNMAAAINNMESETKFFRAVANENNVIIESLFSGKRFNRIKFVVNETMLEDYITFYPDNGTASNFFVGGTDKTQSRIKIKNEDLAAIDTNRYVKTKLGYAQIDSISKYFEPKIKVSNNVIEYYNTYKDYSTLIINDINPSVSTTKDINIFNEFSPSFGRFSFFPIKDFDFDFYSQEYYDQGELFIEADEYNQYISTTSDTLEPIGKSTNPDIVSFYEKGFGRLLGLLQKDQSDQEIQNEIKSEYERLLENYVLELGTISRTVPFINKWVYKNGKDVRNKDYKLNVTPAFGIYSFSPSKDNFTQDPHSYTHEWYYLSMIPTYFSDEDIKKSWSYFDKKVYDSIEAAPGQPYSPGFFQDTENDNFKEYFVVDRLKKDNKWVAIDKQIRYSTFESGDIEQYSSTFFRGVKVNVKEREDANLDDTDKIKLNYNIGNLSFKKNSNFNDYKFSVIMSPHENGRFIKTGENTENIKPDFQIKFIENRKFKTITMMIFIDIDYSFFDDGREYVDRTMLYALKNNIIPNTDGNYPTDNYSYATSTMQGAIDFTNSVGSSPGPYTIKGMNSSNGGEPQFLKDIRVGEDGNYSVVKAEVGGIGGGTYLFYNIQKVSSDNTMTVGNITKDGYLNVNLPVGIPTRLAMMEAKYEVIGGGYNSFLNRMQKASFASIYERVNSGDPGVIYETIYEDGTRKFNQFHIELKMPEAIFKPDYLEPVPDTARPVEYNLTKIIGYRIGMANNVNLIPFFRHDGNYMPKFVDVVKMVDPYIEEDLDQNSYEEKVFNYVRHANTCFNLDSSFGIISNMFYHKVNIENPKAILELNKTKKSAFISNYPLIDEVGIDKRDFYVFMSSWDAGYFIKNLSKSKREYVAGTRSPWERKNFFASKILTIPDHIELETFEVQAYSNLVDITNSDYRIFYDESPQQLILYAYIENKLIDYLYPNTLKTFEKYINSKYAYGSKDSLKDMVRSYIKANVLKRYVVNQINLYVKKVKNGGHTDYSYMTVSDSKKLSDGLNISNDMKISYLVNSKFNIKIVYNKSLDYSYYFGLSVDLRKS